MHDIIGLKARSLTIIHAVLAAMVFGPLLAYTLQRDVWLQRVPNNEAVTVQSIRPIQPATAADVGAIYFCRSQPYAAFKVIQAFRRAHPHGTVLVINDGGDVAHEAIAAHFGALYFYEDNQGYPLFDTAPKLKAKFQTFLKYIDMVPEPWFVKLEDDVIFFRPVPASQLQFDLNGVNYGATFDQPAYEELLQVNPSAKNFYGWMGGSVSRTAAFRSFITESDRYERAFDMLAKYRTDSFPDGEFGAETSFPIVCVGT
jgi:hypothetical protein